ncbi:MAG: UbiH/UbiF/VisC/COQ6 family ubiquinone biosynthesis hydroxylase [Acidiferrobacterales bacterium]
MILDHDVIVVGGGMVGTTLALACAASGMRVAVVDRETPVAEPGDEYDLRVSAITLASKSIFHNLGVWEEIIRRRVSPLRKMHVTDAMGSGCIHFDAAEIGEAELGYIIENRVIMAAARACIARNPNIVQMCPADIVGIEVAESDAVVKLADGRNLRTLLIAGADGAASRVREWAGISSKGWSYDQTAIVATVRATVPHDQGAHQVFLSTGPLAFLPLAEPKLSSMVWSCETQRANALLAMDDHSFRKALQESFGNRLGEIESVSTRAAFPLGLAHATQYVSERVALVGDAAHRVHPLAGQGVNLGLLDAATLAEVVSDANQVGRDIGLLRVLRQYERWRKGANLTMLAITDAFKRGFGSSDWPIRRLRNIGLGAADGFGPIKRLIMRRAAGLSGDLPRAARIVQQ